MEPPHPPPTTHVHITLTVTLNRRLGWVIAGLAVGILQLPDVVGPVAHLIRHAIGSL